MTASKLLTKIQADAATQRAVAYGTTAVVLTERGVRSGEAVVVIDLVTGRVVRSVRCPCRSVGDELYRMIAAEVEAEAGV